MRPSLRGGHKEFVLLERELRGAVKQHKSITALDYCFPSAQLGVPSWSGGPHAGRGRRTQIPTLIKKKKNKPNVYTEDFFFPTHLFLPTAPHPSCLSSTLKLNWILSRVVASPVTACGLFLLQSTLLFLTLLLNNHVSKPFNWCDSLNLCLSAMNFSCI